MDWIQFGAQSAPYMTKLSRRVIMELIRKKDNPFPLAFVGGRYMTTQEKFKEWVEAEIENANGKNQKER